MGRVYQSADEQWIFFNNGIKTFFVTQAEALSMANKIEYAKKVQAVNTIIAQLFLSTKDLDSVYFSEGFDSAGSNPIVDGDISSLGITAAELADGVSLFQQIQKLRNSLTVISGDYQATVNALRSDM